MSKPFLLKRCFRVGDRYLPKPKIGMFLVDVKNAHVGHFGALSLSPKFDIMRCSLWVILDFSGNSKFPLLHVHNIDKKTRLV